MATVSSDEENYVEVPDSVSDTVAVQQSNEEAEDADDVPINNGSADPLPHIPPELEEVEAIEAVTTTQTTTTPEPTTTTVATSTVPMSKCRKGEVVILLSKSLSSNFVVRNRLLISHLSWFCTVSLHRILRRSATTSDRPEDSRGQKSSSKLIKLRL